MNPTRIPARDGNNARILRLLPTPPATATAPAPGPARFDADHPAPHTEALRAAWGVGLKHGFKDGWVRGVRWGILCGACSTLCLAGLMLAAAAGLGWLP